MQTHHSFEYYYKKSDHHTHHNPINNVHYEFACDLYIA